MFRKFSTLTAVCVFAASTYAAPPSLLIPETVKANRDDFGLIPVTGSYKWLKFSAPDIKIIECKEGFKFVGKPGSYTLTAIAGNEEGMTDFQYSRIVIVDNVPNPQPVPDNTTKVDSVFIAVVEEKLNRNLEITNKLNELPTWRSKKGVNMVVDYDKDSGGADARVQSYVDIASKYNNGDWTKPVVIIMDPKGKVISKSLLKDFNIDTMISTYVR